MNILLTTRRCTEEPRNPIGLLDLVAFCRAHGHAVDCYYLDQLADSEEVKDKAYDIVGLSVLQVLDENIPVHDAIYLKKTFNTKTVVGGKWAQTMENEQKTILQDNGIDICVGPGERYFHDGEIDFDSYPSWDLVDFETLKEVNEEVMSSRGCPYHCSFCHNTEKKVSFFSLSRTADNIELLFNLGKKRIFIIDDIFTFRASHMVSLFQELEKRDIHIENRNYFFSHINHLSPDVLEQIALYRPIWIEIGIESGDDRMLKMMGKPFSSKDALNKIELLYRIGINVHALFLIGFPGENEESLKNTLGFIKRIKPFVGWVWVSYYQPVRGTKGYSMVMERVKKSVQGKRNTYLTYVDPNLTEELLFKYRYLMMNVFGRKSLKGLVRKELIKRFPQCFLKRNRGKR